MSRKLGGSRGSTSFNGDVDNPPNVAVEKRDPTIYDVNYELCDFWLNETSWDLFSLVSLYGDGTVKGQVAYWALIGTGSGDLTKLTVPSGQILPISGNINVIGDSNISATQPVPGTLQLSYIGEEGSEFRTSTGVAAPNPLDQTLNVYGAWSIETSTSSTGVPPVTDTIIIGLSKDVSIRESLTVGTTLTMTDMAATPGLLQVDSAGLVLSLEPSVEDTVPTYNAATGITWKVIPGGGGAASSFVTDSGGPVVPLTNVLTVIGKNLIATDGATANTVKIGLTETAASGFVPMAQGAGFAPLWGEIVGGTGITVTPGSGVLTITAGGGGVAGGIIKITGNFASAALEDALNNINIIGATNEIEFNGDGVNTLNVTFSDTLVIPGTLTLGDASFQHAGVLVTSATGVVSSYVGTITGQVLTWDATGVPMWSAPSGGSGASKLVSDSGTATANLLGEINVIGGINIGTTAGTNTLTVNLDLSVLLPKTTTSASAGVIGIGQASTYSLPTDRFIHSYYSGTSGGTNCFVGHGAGSLTSSGANGNTALGEDVLKSLTSGDNNTCAGVNCADALTTAGSNSFYGSSAAGSLVSYSYNSAFGSSSLASMVGTTVINTFNCAFGYKSMYGAVGDTVLNNSAYGAYSMNGALTLGDNCAFGYKSMYAATGAANNSVFGSESALALTTSDNNSFFGTLSGSKITTGSGSNCAFGMNSLYNLVNGHSNSCFGSGAGSALTTDDSHNICINHTGVVGDNNYLRIGTSALALTGITDCAIAGIIASAAPVSTKRKVVYITRSLDGAGNYEDWLDADTTEPALGTILMQGTNGGTFGTLTSSGGSIAITSTSGNINIEQDSTYGFSAYNPTDSALVTGDGTEYYFGVTTSLTEEYDDGGHFYVGSGVNKAYYSAPYNGFYNFCMSVQYKVTMPPAPPPVAVRVDPLYIKVWNSTGVSLIRTYTFDYILPALPAGVTTVLNAQFSAYILLTAAQRVSFSFSAETGTGSKTTRLGGGAGDSYVAGFLVART